MMNKHHLRDLPWIPSCFIPVYNLKWLVFSCTYVAFDLPVFVKFILMDIPKKWKFTLSQCKEQQLKWFVAVTNNTSNKRNLPIRWRFSICASFCTSLHAISILAHAVDHDESLTSNHGATCLHAFQENKGEWKEAKMPLNWKYFVREKKVICTGNT